MEALQRSALAHGLEIVHELATGGALHQFSDGPTGEEVTNHTNGNQTQHHENGDKYCRSIVALVHRLRLPLKRGPYCAGEIA